MQLLKIHNVKEEEVVYAAADRYANAHPDAALANTSLTQAIAAARMPEDWVCAMAPYWGCDGRKSTDSGIVVLPIENCS